MQLYSNTAIVFGSLKTAALYFDKLIPVNLSAEMAISHPDGYGGEETDRTLFPERVIHDPKFLKDLVSVNRATHNLLVKEAIKRFSLNRPAHISENTLKRAEIVAATRFFKLLEEYNLQKLPLDCGEDLFSDGTDDADKAVTSLCGLQLIDASKCSWAQIREFRQDKIAISKLRRLRKLFFENYTNKPRDYVLDDINIRIEEYDESIRKWGFETSEGAFNAIATSKVLGGATAGALASLLAGQPLPALVAGAAGTLFEAGRISFRLAKASFSLREMERTNPVAFVSYAKDRLSLDG